MNTDKNTFRVIVTGGGVAGLTLANSLQRANIPCVLLEARNEIAPAEGASIAISANGGRILDQIGALTEVYNASTPTLRVEGYRHGKLFESSDFPELSLAQSGYSVNFLQRQSLLRILYQSIPNKDAILCGKRVSRIDYSPEGVAVQCKDGTSYEGSLVVGADGVHSIVRQEMWRTMEVESPWAISEKEKHSLSPSRVDGDRLIVQGMTAEYSCMYGISKPVKGLTPGCLYKTYDEGLSFLCAAGKQSQVFWFIFRKLDRRYTIPNIPRFTKQDAEAQAQSLLSQRITDQVTFHDIWEQRQSYLLAPLEEALFNKWTWGRFACIGDSAHKWTPNIGQGGNNAIEDAAALANSLHNLLNKDDKCYLPSGSEITKALEAFQVHRQARAEAAFEKSCKVTRLEALEGVVTKFLALYLLPNSGDFLATMIAGATIGAEKLEFLPDPERSLTGTMAFNPNYGVGQETSLLKRAGLGLPLLTIGYFCYTIIQAIIHHPRMNSQIISILSDGKFNSTSGPDVHLAPNYFGGVSWLESRFRPLIVVFAPSMLNFDLHHRLQMISFLTDLAPVFLIWLLESHRRANAIAFARFPLIFGIASQLYGVGSIGPLYFFLHYIQSPLSKFAALDQRLVNVGAAQTALPAVALAYSLPSLAMYFSPDLATRLRINATWQLFPVWLSITHYILTKLFVKDTTKHDRIYKPLSDLPHIRLAMKTLAIVSALVFNWVRWQSSSSLLTVFLPHARRFLDPVATFDGLDLISGVASLLRTDQISCVLACFIWLALLFKDLKEAEMVRATWLKLVSYAMLSICICGPGAVVAMGWLWREEILASKRAKGAVVRKPEN